MRDALFIFVILFAMGFMLMYEFLARPRIPEVAVTTPLAVIVPISQKVKRIRLKPRVVVIPVVVGAAACAGQDDGSDCKSIYDFRQRCSASWRATR